MGLKELEEDPEALLQLMAHRATTHPADLEAEDIGRMMSQAERGRFRMPSRQPKSVYVRDTPGYSAKKMTFSWDRMDQGQQLKTMQMLAKFWMIDSDFYELVLGRKSNIDMVLGHVVDEYLTTYSRQTNAPLTLAPIWAPNAANMSIGQLEEYWERTIVASRASMSARAQERARYLEDDQDEQGQAAGEEEEAAEDEPETKEEEVDYPAEAPMEETGLSGSDHGTVGADGTVVRDAVVMMATALKEEGNTIYQANGPRCLELAMGRYQSAIDALHQLPHGSLKDDDGLKLMAMLKSNTANIFLKQANLAPLPAQKVDLANKALAACDYVLNHEVR